jgi:putative transposase
MPRFARIVMAGTPHHITQRGTDRQRVFRSRRDHRVYLDLLREQAELTSVSILAYCLMPNHIHLIATPPEEDDLAVLLRRVHGRYAQFYNALRMRSGHLWQNRFYSCPLGPGHLWTAARYVEQNPIRAGLALREDDWTWSSAAAHLTGQDRWRVLDLGLWREAGGAGAWKRLLDWQEEEAVCRQLRRATHAGQPFGDEGFAEAVRTARREQRMRAAGTGDGKLVQVVRM